LSLLLLQKKNLAAFMMAGSVATTFELFTHEWLRNPVRVEAAQEARRASARASDSRAATLGVRSHVTGLPDGMGMNIAIGAKKLQQDADDLGITADEKVQADRGLAGFFSARASDGRAATLVVSSCVTGLPDGMGMNIAGGAQKVKKDAHDLGISADDKVQADRSTLASFGGRATAGRNAPTASSAAALASRGVSNPNMTVNARNPDALRLGAEIGSVVMGQEQWERYITTSTKEMNKEDKPTPQHVSQKLAAERPSGEREGWVFHHVARTAPRWAMTDKITFTLPGHTEEKPVLHIESMREAISEAYHKNWYRYSAAKNKDQKDKDAGTKLSRSNKTHTRTHAHTHKTHTRTHAHTLHIYTNCGAGFIYETGHVSIYLCTSLSIYLSIYPSIYPSIHLSS